MPPSEHAEPPRLFLFVCPEGPHVYEAVGTKEQGHEDLDVVKCLKHATSGEPA